ncbi:Zinc finger, CCHC-type [Quillaja saponaria]|uniref:Zinc finger, CCHC-type n=1 Tax=Quillaja saponaria TaxID=32244 RepID=A0AAD7LBD9_QUISA|nr:Zinc finger, CCHC-type [Quillaja saponaria]
MTFVASDPLSELVWSPDKGLSLRCADSSFTDKKASQLWDVGPSNLSLSPPLSIVPGRCTTDRPEDENTFVKPASVVCGMSYVAGTDLLIRSPMNTSDSGVLPACKSYQEHEIGQVERTPDNLSLQADLPKPILLQNDPVCKDPISRGIYISSPRQTLETDNVFGSEVQPVIECNSSSASEFNMTSPGRCLLEKLETTAENDLRNVNCEAYDAASKTVLTKPAHENENKFENDDLMLPADETLPVIHLPTNGRIHEKQKKDKEKALSYGNVNGRTSKGDDDSRESVESCNSAELFPSGKKRWNFEQQLIIGSKRAKKQAQETPGSTSRVRRDSSFMNWISNMLKGFSQRQDEEATSLALALADSDHVLHCPDQKPMTCNKNQDPGLKHTGFQSIFQSIYCPSLKNVEIRMSSANGQLGEVSKDLDLDNKAHGINATPITFCAENDSFNKQLLQSNDKFEGSTCRYDNSPSFQPKILPVDFVSSHSLDNKSSCTLGVIKEKERLISNSSLGKHKVNTVENISSDIPSEGKATHTICHRSDPLGSLLITRFSAKSTAPLLNCDNLNQRSSGTLLCSTDCSKLPHFENLATCPDDNKIVEAREHVTSMGFLLEAKELRNCATNDVVSTWSKNIKSCDDHRSVNKLNLVSPSLSFKNSEATVPMFARRLDALKHMIPSNVMDNVCHASITCFFCGIKGHQFRDCSEIAGSELEDLAKNMNTYDEVKELPCLCIKCFQPNHWAIACPNTSSTGKHQVEVNASLVKHWSPCGIQLNAGNVENAKAVTRKELQFEMAGVISDEIEPKLEGDLNLKWKSKKIIKPNKIDTSASIKKCTVAGSAENTLKENHITSSCNSIERQISDVPKGIFDAIRKLRLSRTAILKWINSSIPLFKLDGLFVRLRLGKWEEGLGGTGYYVASITGVRRQSSEQNAKNSLSANVGGIKCLFESQYVSNHDFLEDELVAWWRMTLRAGGRIPSIDDLMEKIEKKNILGL